MRTEMVTPDGVEIIAREPGLAPHPHPQHQGKLVQFTNLNKVLLVGGGELFECDVCGYTNANPNSVTSHMTVHNPDRVGTRYPQSLLRAVAKAVAIARRGRGRDVMARAAADLNAQGITMLKGAKWDSHNVSHVFNLYCKDIKVRVPQRKTPADDQQRAQLGPNEELALAPWSGDDGAVVVPDGPITHERLTHAMEQLHASLQSAAYELRVIMAGLHRLEPNDPDPVVAAKAERWDQYVKMTKELLGE